MERPDQPDNEYRSTPADERQFIYRHNRDGSIDSICVRCLRTVAKARETSKLELEEREHVCQRIWASRRSVMRNVSAE
jgi:hypothetical protein